MEKTIPQETFATEFLGVLEELFDTHHGFFLDKDAPLLATVDGITAEAASAPIAGGVVTIASHVEHVIFYIDVLGKEIAGETTGELDWEEIWERVGEVDAAQWNELRSRLRAKYAWLTEVVSGVEDWRKNEAVGAAIVILAHTACHLGVIRQAIRAQEVA